MTEPPSVRDAELLREFLVGREVQCPGCGYSLRGLSQQSCPECGTVLRLSVHHGDAIRAWRWLLLLAFGWVALAGLTMTASVASSTYSIAAMPRKLAARGMSVSASSVQVLTGPSGNSVVTAQGLTSARAAAPSGPPPPLAWSSVSPWQWAHLAIAAALGVGGVVGFIVVWYYRRRPCPPRRLRHLVAVASAMFGAWGAWYLWIAVRTIGF